MKKVLFATTALIATASMAAADVRISGYGRFGLDYNSGNEGVPTGTGTDAPETSLTSRLRIQFDVSTETDGGVVFNARLRAQGENRDGSPGTVGFNSPRFGVSWEGLTVNVGNIIGAIENAPGLYTTNISAGTGIDGMGFKSLVINGANWDAYSSTNGTSVDAGGTSPIDSGNTVNGVEVLYSTGGFTGHISYSQRNDTVVGGAVVPPAVGQGSGEQRTGLMLTYSFGDYYATAAYQSSSDGPLGDAGEELNDGIGFIAFGADFGQFGGAIAYGTTEAADSWKLEGNYDIGAASNIQAWVTDVSTNNVLVAGTDPVTDGTNWGLNYQYDLGGGATFVAGYVDGADDTEQFQAGVWFRF